MSFAFVTENQLDAWVRSHSVKARSLIPTLINRLVAKSCPHAKERRFPSGDSIDQPGFDGFLSDENGFPPFVPAGDSYWEMGTGPAKEKATKEYDKRTEKTCKETRQNSTLVIVNPRSATKEWRNSKGENDQESWLNERDSKNEWKKIKLVDGTVIADWLIRFPNIGKWLAERIVGLPEQHVETVEHRWKLLQSYGGPNPLTPELFLGNRVNAIQLLQELLPGEAKALKLLTRFPDQVADFVCAFISSLENEDRSRISSRTLIVSDPHVWSSVCEIYEGANLILIADSSLDLSGESGSRMIQKAIASGHSVIYDAPYGGPNEDLTFRLQDPGINDIYQALSSAGISDHQTRRITNICGRNLNQILRMLKGEALRPKWAEKHGSDDLVFALLAGSWCDYSLADREIIQVLTGKNYIEWTRNIRKAAGFRNPPVIETNGWWKFVSRFEGWHSLGRILDEDHLHRLYQAVDMALRPDTFRLQLTESEYNQALRENKEFFVSSELQKGLAESIALMGAYPTVSDSLTTKRLEGFVSHTVRDVLAGFGSKEWARSHKILPLLAEASPNCFFDAFQNALEYDDSPIVKLSSPELRLGLKPQLPFGLLWAFESIAWDRKFLSRACALLGKLSDANLEPHENDQPLKSLSKILFPLVPQTIASAEHRMDVVRTVVQDTPHAGWNLLLDLFPSPGGVVTINYRPVWRKVIPDDWTPAISTPQDQVFQNKILSDLVVDLACSDYEKLSDERFLELLPDLSHSAFNRVLSHLSSDIMSNWTVDQRLDFWKQLARLHRKHSDFPDARWSTNENDVLGIGKIVDKIAPKDPTNVAKIVFSNDISLLLTNSEDWDVADQEKVSLRIQTMKKLIDSSSFEEVINFVEVVEDSGSYGFYLAKFADSTMDRLLLPDNLEPNTTDKYVEFIQKYVGHRWFLERWNWVDELDCLNWTPAQIGKFLGWLPFSSETWERVNIWLASDEAEYWQRTHASFTRDFEGDSDIAIEKLISYGRSQTAIEYLADLLFFKKPFSHHLACKALLAAMPPKRGLHISNAYKYGQIVKDLQSNSDTPVEILLKVEWRHFDLFDSHLDVLPKTIERQLSTDPVYFCEVVANYVRLRSLTREELKHFNQYEIDMRNHAYFMFGLHWKAIPGMTPSEDFVPEIFEEWLNEVYRLCDTPELLEQAQQFIGEAILHAPEDPDGLWIHHAVAKALNDPRAQTMRSSCLHALRNSRGIFRVEGTGAQERELSQKYRKMAEQTEEARFHRLADTLIDVAQRYEEEANDAINRDDLED